MPERIQEILNRIIEWWKHFTTRQKALIISLASVVVIAFGILAFVVTRPVKVELITCTSAEESQQVSELLEGAGIASERSADGMTYTINQDKLGDARILLGTNKIPSKGYSISDVLDGSFSTTEADKQKKYQLYLEESFAEDLATISNISSANVNLSLPSEDGTMLAQQQEAYASVILHLSGEMDDEQAAGIAQYIATELGNDTTNNIKILDGDGNMLFSGSNESSAAGLASANLTAREKAKASIAKGVKDVILGTNIYDNVDVAINLSMNFDEQTIDDYLYYVAEGQKQGYLDSRTEATSENTTGVAGVPGTDTNDDDTTYVMQDGENGYSNTSEVTEDYLPNETITHTKKEVGAMLMNESSITVVATSYVPYSEDTLKATGELDDMTFDEFVAQNNQRVKTEVDEDFYNMVANATGIPVDNISIVAYDIPFFQYSEGSGRDLTDYLQILLAVLIFAMLGYVVFRSMRRPEEEEAEDELSVEALLESTKEEDLEDIGFNEKSDARLLIEKFVDERPEAVASLLRNWLNEDWS